MPYRWVDRRGGRVSGLRGDRRDVLAARLPPADDAGDRVVAHRHLQRHDDRLSRDGGRQRRLGRLRRPIRARARSRSSGAVLLAVGLALASGARAVAVPARLRAAGRASPRRRSCADDGDGDGLVRHPSQPCRVAGFGRHGHGADDHVALRRLADLAVTTGARRYLSSPVWSLALMIPAALLVRRAAGARQPPRPPTPAGGAGDDAWRGFALAAVHHSAARPISAAARPIPVRSSIPSATRCPAAFRPIAAVSIYSVEGLAGMGGRIGVRPRSATSSAPSVARRRAAGAGAGRAGLFLRCASSAGSTRWRRSSVHLCRGHAALRRDGAREFPAAHDGHRDRGTGMAGQPGHGAGAAARRLDLRRLRQLWRALSSSRSGSASARR